LVLSASDIHYANHMAATSPTAERAAHATRGGDGRGAAGDWAAMVEGAAEPKGAKAESGSSASGLGGLGLDGMVAAASDGGSASSPGPGDGSSGIMSGDNAGGMMMGWPPWRGRGSG
jgi:hypothetical protein